MLITSSFQMVWEKEMFTPEKAEFISVYLLSLFSVCLSLSIIYFQLVDEHLQFHKVYFMLCAGAKKQGQTLADV